MPRQKKYIQKLFTAYTLLYLAALALLFFLVSGLFYSQQYSHNKQTMSALVYKTSQQIDSSLQSMDRIATGLLFNNSFIEIMKDEDAILHYTDYSNQVLNAFTALDAPLFSTWRIIAFNNSQYYNLSKSAENQMHIKRAISEYDQWDDIIAENGQKTITPLHVDPFDSSGTLVYSVTRAITDGHAIYGAIEVQNTYEYLRSLCSATEKTGQLLLISPENELIYPLSETENCFSEELISRINAQEADSGSFHCEGKLVFYDYSDYSGWTTLLCCPIGQVVPSGAFWFLSILILFALLTIGVVFAIRTVTRRMTAPLVNLNNALKQVSIDNLSLSLPQQYGIEEIESINHSFSVMFQHLKESISKNIQLRASEERANYLALQSQMNPHTIYNTMGMIESISYMHGDKEVANLCVCFSRMLQYISDYSHREYTVRDELAFVSNYSVLTESRFSKKLAIYIDADPVLLGNTIPKFTIQPLVENSVKYGLGRTCPHLDVNVAVGQCPDYWFISVKDNGCGFSDDSLQEIHKQIARCDESLKEHNDLLTMKIGHLTLSNIYIRWKILFGDRFTLEVRNLEEGQGGFVMLRVQKEEQDFGDN